AAPAPATGASEYKVRPGDTLSRVAGRTQAPGISLDQMLVGLYRSNPDAFIDNNMNRLKSGSVLQVPASDALGSLSNSEARQVIQAQSADFDAYRQRLAGGAPTLKQDVSERQAKGKVQAAVDDRKPAAATTPDKLTLSKAASAAPEAKTSKETEKKDAAARVAELTRNVEELKKLSSAASTTVPTPAPAPAPVVAAAPASVPAMAAPAMAAASAPQERASAAVAAAAPAAAASKPRPAAMTPTPAPAPEPGLLDQLLDSSVLLPLAGLLVALGGFGLYKLRGRKSAGKADTGFHESRLQPDSFFGASGGQRVDTRDATNGPSSMSYSLSQLDAIGDVDPVAEADVYLAYGRDLQAEEILKEALRANPERLAIRLKLLEVYAKRRDTKGFEQLAVQLYAETHGSGEDWAKAQELGRQIDADNPLYQPGGAPMASGSGHEPHPEPMNASTLPATVSAGGSSSHLATEPLGLSVTQVGPPSAFSLDLDLDLGGAGASAPAPVDKPAVAAMAATQAMMTTVEHAPLAMDFDLSRPPPAMSEQGSDDLLLDLDELGGDDEPSTVSNPPADVNSLDFDLSSIDLDLPSDAPVAPAPVDTTMKLPSLDQAGEQLSQALEGLDDLGTGDEEPLLRQLELADEFRQIGDTEGAREVLQELLAKAGGPLRERAQAMLKELG
ncbi:MAG: FimV/HubP family polar landmark protein, partial [Burkholderiaceae bacterium]